ACTHTGKSFVTRSIQEYDFAFRSLHQISTDMLSNTTKLTGGYLGVTHVVEQTRFTMVNVTHDRNDRRTTTQGTFIVRLSVVLNIIFVTDGYDLQLNIKLR